MSDTMAAIYDTDPFMSGHTTAQVQVLQHQQPLGGLKGSEGRVGLVLL